jgi:AcrR family transcriptional regulator
MTRTGSDVTRSRILRAAETCFDRDGGSNLTIISVAEEVNLSRPSVYRYFATREELVATLLATGFRRLNVRILETVDLLPTASEALVEAFGCAVDAVANDHYVSLAARPEWRLDTGASTRNAPIIEVAAELWHSILFRRIKQGQLRLDLDVAAAAAWLADLELNFMDRSQSGAMDPTTVPHLVTRFVLPGILKADESG